MSPLQRARKPRWPTIYRGQPPTPALLPRLHLVRRHLRCSERQTVPASCSRHRPPGAPGTHSNRSACVTSLSFCAFQRPDEQDPRTHVRQLFCAHSLRSWIAGPAGHKPCSSLVALGRKLPHAPQSRTRRPCQQCWGTPLTSSRNHLARSEWTQPARSGGPSCSGLTSEPGEPASPRERGGKNTTPGPQDPRSASLRAGAVSLS